VSRRRVWASLVLAGLAEGMLAAAHRLVGGEGLAMSLWIWPLAWLVLLGAGVAAQPRQPQTESPALAGTAAPAGYLLRLLASNALLLLTPAVVAAYAAIMLVVAIRAAA